MKSLTIVLIASIICFVSSAQPRPGKRDIETTTQALEFGERDSRSTNRVFSFGKRDIETTTQALEFGERDSRSTNRVFSFGKRGDKIKFGKRETVKFGKK